MTPANRFFVVLEESIDSASIVDALPAGVPVRVVSLLEAEDGAFTDLQAAADVVIVGCAKRHEEAVRVIEGAVRQRPERPVVALHVGSPNGFMERAFRAGADDLIALPLPGEELRFALEKALARRRGPSAPSEAPLIAVLGPKGGTGKTIVSSNLVVALAQAGHSAVVVDLDLQFGDIGLALGLPPSRTIYDLATAGGSLDADKLDAFLVTHPSGAKALLAPVRPDQAAAVDRTFLNAVYEQLRTRYDYVIVDTPPSFSSDVIATIDVSTSVVVVGMLDALSLKDTKIGLETLERMGYGDERITLVLNRADSSVGIESADVERLFGRGPDVRIPSDRGIPRALTKGSPIVLSEPKSGAAQAFTALAARFGAARAGTDRSPESDRAPRRLLSLRGAKHGAA